MGSRSLGAALAAGIAVMFMLAMTGAEARAQSFAVSADALLRYEAEGGTFARDEMGGAVLGFNLGSALGVGATVIDFKELAGERGRIALLDLFWDAPVPVLSLRLGGGYGQSLHQFTVPIQGPETTSSASELFLHLGYAFVPLFELHLGYHVIQAEQDLVDMSGNLLTLGVRIGW